MSFSPRNKLKKIIESRKAATETKRAFFIGENGKVLCFFFGFVLKIHSKSNRFIITPIFSGNVKGKEKEEEEENVVVVIEKDGYDIDEPKRSSNSI